MEPHVEVYVEDRELVEKLAKLQSMHQQITDLRGLLPERLLGPTRMAIENPRSVSPEKLAANLRTAATDGSRDIQRFKKNFHSPEMRELWQKTNVAEFPQGRDDWTVDYQDLIKGPKWNDKTSSIPVNANPSAEPGLSEDSDAVIKRFQESSPELKIDYASPLNLYPLSIGLDGMSFRISQGDHNGNKPLTIEQGSDSESSDLMNEVMTQVNERSNPASLEVLLSMLLSYHDLKFKTCEKCQNTFSDDMEYPLLRHRKSPTESDNEKIEWQVLHRSCVS